MCEFFSFSVDKNGFVYALFGEERLKAQALGHNPDSHSYISDHFHIDEDKTWKFEIPLDKSDIDRLCEDLMPEKLQIKDINTLAKWYDGGLPFEEFPVEYVKKVMRWICDHLEDIKKAGLLKFSHGLAEQIFECPGQTVIELAVARTKWQLAWILAKYIISKGWGWNEDELVDLICGSKGWFREWEEDGELKRQRCRILNWKDETIYRIFVSRYQAPFISRKGGEIKVGTEDRIFIYPVLAIEKEGEVR